MPQKSIRTSFLRLPARLFGLLLLPLLLNACTGLYFKTLTAPGEPLRIGGLGDLPRRDRWHGFVFNGEKVGFVHLKIMELPDDRLYRVVSEARLRIRFLGTARQIDLKSDDVVGPDLKLVSFRYVQRMDDDSLVLEGRVSEGILTVRQQRAEQQKTVQTALSGALYPSSLINLYPVMRGLAVGARYRYDVYDPQTQSIAEVRQSVLSFEESRALSVGPSFRIETDMRGHRVSSWIDLEGETVFETALGGVLITHREDEGQAKRFLAEASFNKKDVVFDFSLIRTDRPIRCPRDCVSMQAALWGLSGVLPVLSGPNQTATEASVDGEPAVVFVVDGSPPGRIEPAGLPLEAAQRALFLAPTHHLESDHPDIRKAAEDAVRGERRAREKIEHLARWVSREVRDDATDSYSALEVLHRRKGECQAHAMLYAAMARAAGIPTKLVGGIVYLDGVGFLYHSWAESYADAWIPVDPTFEQIGVDATHIKLVEGPDWTSLLALGRVIGQLRLRVIEYACPSAGIPAEGKAP